MWRKVIREEGNTQERAHVSGKIGREEGRI